MNTLLNLFFVLLSSIPLARSDFQSPIIFLKSNNDVMSKTIFTVLNNPQEINQSIYQWITLQPKVELKTVLLTQNGHNNHQHFPDNSDSEPENNSSIHDAHIEVSNESHDHNHQHTEAIGIWNMVRFIGKIHPMVIHFPIAMLIVTGFSEFLFLILKNSFYRKISFYTLDLTVFTMIAAVAIGWSAGSFAEFSLPLASTFWYHKWIGTTTLIVTIFTWYLSKIIRSDVQSKLQTFYRFSLFISVILVSMTGHFGAMLIYGWDHFVS